MSKDDNKRRPNRHSDVELELLINGEEYYPRLYEDIRAAKETVRLETFILFDDEVGRELADLLCETANRGVDVDLTIDGWGSAYLPDRFTRRLLDCGVHLHVFDPTPSAPRKLGLRPNLFKRMHRKLVTIDRKIAYVGGINFGEDHLAESHPEGKQDYAVRAVGTVAEEIDQFIEAQARLFDDGAQHRWHLLRDRVPKRWVNDDGGNEVFFVSRDNRVHRSDIERFYKMALRRAKKEVIIANAYFFPSYGFIWQMRRAVTRGVRVVLILQGQPDKEYVRSAASTLYDYLLDAGVEVYEYTQRPLHGKIAAFDDAWCTVGSSNLDPLSLSLNLEANLFINDRGFTAKLRDHLLELQAEHCTRITREVVPRQRGWRHIVRIIAFHIIRRFPQWLSKIPPTTQRVKSYLGGERVANSEYVSEHGA